MNDVNLNGPDLKLVRPSEQAPPRASTSPLNEGSNASARPVPDVSVVGSNPEALKVSREEAQKEIEQSQLDAAVSQLNEFVQNVQRDLQFEVDNDLGQTIVRVVDQSTQEVIRQIPDEVAVRLAEKLQQDEPLTLFNLKV